MYEQLLQIIFYIYFCFNRASDEPNIDENMMDFSSLINKW